MEASATHDLPAIDPPHSNSGMGLGGDARSSNYLEFRFRRCAHGRKWRGGGAICDEMRAAGELGHVPP
jgi:hypothetical protein